MAPNRIMKYLVTVVLTMALMAVAALAQCGCAPDQCCSQYGFCGKDAQYCGTGCQAGPCYSTSGGGVSVPDIVTAEFFNGITDQNPSCPGRSFYSREAFLNGLSSFSDFGKLGSEEDSKREIAAFFAHVSHETGRFCFIEENLDQPNTYCDQDTEFPCAPGKSYHGRGPIQLTGNRNYGAAGKALKLDLLNSPETVATDAVVSFKTALWFWLTQVRPSLNQGFGATIRAINGPRECGGLEPDKVRSRVNYYTDYCSRVGVAPGDNLYC